jgi:hypothetical protein
LYTYSPQKDFYSTSAVPHIATIFYVVFVQTKYISAQDLKMPQGGRNHKRKKNLQQSQETPDNTV